MHLRTCCRAGVEANPHRKVERGAFERCWSCRMSCIGPGLRSGRVTPMVGAWAFCRSNEVFIGAGIGRVGHNWRGVEWGRHCEPGSVEEGWGESKLYSRNYIFIGHLGNETICHIPLGL